MIEKFFAIMASITVLAIITKVTYLYLYEKNKNSNS